MEWHFDPNNPPTPTVRNVVELQAKLDAGGYKPGASIQVETITDHGKLPAHIRENPAPGPWVHVTGTDANGDPVEYWCGVNNKDGREALGQRLVAAANGHY